MYRLEAVYGDTYAWHRSSRGRRETSGLHAWLSKLASRAHSNVVAVALANKLARMAWALLTKGELYRPPLLAADAVPV